MKNFTKNDNGFICEKCGKTVPPLGYTSRDHCPHCLYSKHVDIMPGDRANTCAGLLRPIAIETSNKKGYIINYICEKCGEKHRNKYATDDSMRQILNIMSGQYKY